MVLLTVIIRNNRQFNYAPFFAINQFSRMFRVDILRYHTFGCFDTEIRYAKTA